MRKLAERSGLDMARWSREVDAEGLSQMLQRTTDELVSRGDFGVPTFFVNGADMYFGDDRLEFVREALRAFS